MKIWSWVLYYSSVGKLCFSEYKVTSIHENNYMYVAKHIWRKYHIEVFEIYASWVIGEHRGTLVLFAKLYLEKSNIPSWIFWYAFFSTKNKMYRPLVVVQQTLLVNYWCYGSTATSQAFGCFVYLKDFKH